MQAEMPTQAVIRTGQRLSHVRQTTLGSTVCVSGIGMHTGAESRVALKPAGKGCGICFVTGGTRINAVAANVTNTRRCTGLGLGAARVDTVEHLLSALSALQVDNCDIAVDGPELPILDGSALPWVKAILDAGIAELDERVYPLRLTHPVVLNMDSTWIAACPSDSYSITCVTHFDHPMLRTDIFTYSGDPSDYRRDLAPARTFGFAEEVEALLQAGLARGGSLDNALIIHRDRFSDALRVPQEWLRHKTVDLIGDLSLVGSRFHAVVTAIRPSHHANVAFAARLMEALA